MDYATRRMLEMVDSMKDTYPKALANFLFREIIEDAHVKYGIKQEDIKAMCKQAVNRAAMFLKIQNDPEMYKAFAIYAVMCSDWDDVEETEEIKAELKMLRSLI